MLNNKNDRNAGNAGVVLATHELLPALAPVAATRTGLKLVPVMNVQQID
jgi:hypothetical protein